MRIVFIFLIIFLISFGLNIQIAKATTGEEELQAQILRLQAQIAELEKQLTELRAESWCHDFKVNLKYKEEREEVRALQIALKKEGLFKGSATGFFGLITFQSVKLFQEKYKKEILSPWGFKKGTGFVGPNTRTKLNELYGCSQVQISSLKLQPGDTLVIKVKTDSPQVEGKFKSEEIKFLKLGENLVGILGISVNEKTGKYDLSIDLPEGTFLKKKVEIIERKFPISELLVTEELKEKGFTPSKIKENIAKENQKMYQVLQIFTPKPYFNQNFIYPLKEIKDVGAFGNIRKSGKILLQHLGVDLEAATGTPVYAINDGVVSFAKEFTNYGKTLIIDHGMGIFSLYLHLNEFKVFEGQKVKRGDIIALSGNTGYSISPHLHFSLKINGKSIDPLRFIETVKKEMREE